MFKKKKKNKNETNVVNSVKPQQIQVEQPKYYECAFCKSLTKFAINVAEIFLPHGTDELRYLLCMNCYSKFIENLQNFLNKFNIDIIHGITTSVKVGRDGKKITIRNVSVKDLEKIINELTNLGKVQVILPHLLVSTSSNSMTINTLNHDVGKIRQDIENLLNKFTELSKCPIFTKYFSYYCYDTCRGAFTIPLLHSRIYFELINNYINELSGVTILLKTSTNCRVLDRHVDQGIVIHVIEKPIIYVVKPSFPQLVKQFHELKVV